LVIEYGKVLYAFEPLIGQAGRSW